MAIISDIAGTTENSFSINGKMTLYQIDKEFPDATMGQDGDICSNKFGRLFLKQTVEVEGNFVSEWRSLVTNDTLPLPTDNEYKLIYSSGNQYSCTPNLTYEADTLRLSTDLNNNSNDSFVIDDNTIPNIGYLNENYLIKNKDIIYKDSDDNIIAKIHCDSSVNDSKLELSSFFNNNESKIGIISEKVLNQNNEYVEKQYVTAPTPSDKAKDDELITAKWARENIKPRKIGELIHSNLPFKDTTGLQLCDGSFVDKNIYEDFYNYILNDVRPYNTSLVLGDITSTTDGRTEEEKKHCFYITSDGVYVPDYSNIGSLSPTNNISDLGKYSKGEIPNITGRHTLDSNTRYYQGAFYVGDNVESSAGAGLGWGEYCYFDASRCSPLYTNTNVIIPENVKIYVYMVIATSVTGDDSSLDVNALISQINIYKNQVNDISSMIKLKMGFPDYTRGISISNGYEALSNGYVYIKRSNGSSRVYLYVNNVEVDSNLSNTTTEGGGLHAFVKKGDIITWTTENVSGSTFFPLIGE